MGAAAMNTFMPFAAAAAGQPPFEVNPEPGGPARTFSNALSRFGNWAIGNILPSLTPPRR
jgi:hypothetical protein